MAIHDTESGGGANCGEGGSGEFGCFQYLPATWNMFAKEVLGYVPEQTKVNEKYVAMKKISKWLAQGYNVQEIALIWNSGSPTGCSSGVNKHGVAYNSCQYAAVVLDHYKN